MEGMAVSDLRRILPEAHQALAKLDEGNRRPNRGNTQ
jgi:hypothetical protein